MVKLNFWPFNRNSRKAAKDAKLEELKRDIELDDHKIPIKQLYVKLETDPTKGLGSEDAAERLKTNGPNSLTPPKQTPVWLHLLKDMFGGFSILLWMGSVASFVAYGMERHEQGADAPQDNLYLGIVLAVVVTVTGFFQFYQESKSSSIMKSFAKLVPPMVEVIRDENEHEIMAANLVVGDIVLLKGGDRVPADVRIIEAFGFKARNCRILNTTKVDNSSITGENEPLRKTPEFTHDNPLESKNFILFGTNVVEGNAKGVVILTGDHTVMGRIAALVTNVSSRQTPIAKEMQHFVYIIAGVAAIVGVTFFFLSWLVADNGIIESFIVLIGIIVANVPEGIVATVTVVLTLTAKRMKKKMCLVKNLQAVETLGSTSTICSDKTGTLTQNRMTVTHLWANLDIWNVSPEDPVLPELVQGGHCLSYVFRCAALCSRAHFKGEEEDSVPVVQREAIGDASEIAILKFCELAHGDVDEYRQGAKKVFEVPFNSTNKYQISIHDQPEGKYLLVMKGAPERIFDRCATIACANGSKTIDEDVKRQFHEAYEQLGGLGERVLGLCDLELDPTAYPTGFAFDNEPPNYPLEGFRFLGLISMIDPPRVGVPAAVKLCQNAGIRVVMVTGDHPITARAIATQVNIINEDAEVALLLEDSHKFENAIERSNGETAIVVHGEQLKKLSSEELDQIVEGYEQVVFSRTSPAQKLQIVEAYQRMGDVVAVTGDGVNDAPALRKADIGVAMGIAGTEVSKQAADMILLDDNFASIVTGVEEGRLIFDNLKKSIAYTLSSNIPEITPFLAHIAVGIPLPLSIVAILCIDLGTDMWPAIALAYEPAESDIMSRPPRNSKTDKLVNWKTFSFSYLQIGVIQAIAGFTVYFVIMYENCFPPGSLVNIRRDWDHKNLTITDSCGQHWEYGERKDLERCCYAAFFFATVVTQWADNIISKTRMNSIIHQGFSNHVLNFGLVFTTLLSMLLIYTPGINTVLQFGEVRLLWALVPLPFAFAIVLYDECRRAILRRYPHGIVYRITYY